MELKNTEGSKSVSTAPNMVVGQSRAARWAFNGCVIILCLWVLVPIYLLIANALSSPSEVTAFPKKMVPSLDTESVEFFLNFYGVGKALWSSVQVAFLTMIMSIMSALN